MVTLEETLQLTHDWAVDRIHTLCDREDQDLLLNIEDAHEVLLQSQTFEVVSQWHHAKRLTAHEDQLYWVDQVAGSLWRLPR